MQMPKIPFWVFIILAILYFSAIRIDTMDVDASQYAEMSREMLMRGDYLHVYDRGAEYLDKPPFLFWASALGMKVFGVNNIGYKIPSILFALLALYATYRLARRLYDENTGRMAALILGTCQGFFLMTNDIRCDTILMAWVITAIWAIKECEIKRRWYFVLLGVCSIAFGLMTKGPIALLVPLFALMSDWVLKRNWKHIFNPIHLLDAVLISILLIPMCIGLYQQFDMHPEKTVNGLQHVSGLRFFFWTQSFGRITGESPWQNGADFSFLLVNMLWSFLPWIFILIPALVWNIVVLIKQKFKLKPEQEWMSTGGFLLAYLALGSSKYQLPHYIFVAFPLAAILCAAFLTKIITEAKYHKWQKFYTVLFKVLPLLLFMAVLVLITFVFNSGVTGILLWLAAFAIWVYIAFIKKYQGKIIWPAAAGMLLINIFITHFCYAPLLKYEVGAVCGKFIKDHGLPCNRTFAYKMKDPLNAISFYAQGLIKRCDSLSSNAYFLVSEDGLNDIKAKFTAYKILINFRNNERLCSELRYIYFIGLNSFIFDF
jgi:4-amino-4-deoxy-L-arabinose transferase-like glycosyltransferase